MCGGVLFAAPPALTLPDEVKALPGTFVVITPETDAKTVTWVIKDPNLSVLPAKELADPRKAILVGLKAGEYKLVAVGSLDDEHTVATTKLIIEGKIDPTPQPGPSPAPDPTPEPQPKPLPVPTTDFRVIIIHDSATKMTKEQLHALNSSSVAKLLDEKCSKDTNGRPGWRKWDPDQDVSYELPVWKSLWGATKPQIGTLPQVVIVKNQEGKIYSITDEGSLLHLIREQAEK